MHDSLQFRIRNLQRDARLPQEFLSMPQPEFTSEEKYLLNYLKSDSARQTSNPFLWGYLLGGVLLAGFAAYHENPAMMLSAFAVVCGFRLYEEWHQRRYQPLWRSIIQKYEQALGSTE
jgi:hypothetical protein